MVGPLIYRTVKLNGQFRNVSNFIIQFCFLRFDEFFDFTKQLVGFYGCAHLSLFPCDTNQQLTALPERLFHFFDQCEILNRKINPFASFTHFGVETGPFLINLTHFAFEERAVAIFFFYHLQGGAEERTNSDLQQLQRK